MVNASKGWAQPVEDWKIIFRFKQKAQMGGRLRSPIRTDQAILNKLALPTVQLLSEILRTFVLPLHRFRVYHQGFYPRQIRGIRKHSTSDHFIFDTLYLINFDRKFSQALRHSLSVSPAFETYELLQNALTPQTPLGASLLNTG